METLNKTASVASEFVIVGLDDVPHQKLVGAAILITLSLILLGSFANIGVITLSRPLHTPMYFFICTLALVDILYTSSVSVTMLNVLLGEDRTVPFGLCILQHFLFHLGTTMEPFTIALMAYDRLVAISNPLRYQSILTNARVFSLIAFTWAIGCAVSGTFTGFVGYLPFCRTNVLQYCFCEYASLVRAACVDPAYYFNTASVVFTVVLVGNFFLIVFSYVKIVYEVVKLSSAKDQRKVFNTCSSHLIVVVCFFVPKFLLIVVTRVGLVLTISTRNGLIICSTLGPSLVNPYIYCLKNKDIRGRLQSVFKGSVISPKS
ncbi:olfactory receptor 10G4-like [Anguilla anguilla]|uniref:olfactory receptor 10G4-like n=1 Tax=Anguilla anguilla TaxID=7936 RepID=UPI0015B2C24B|nr:olfactory receptor 10G4-like [Anguilla anguilla]